MSCDIAAIKAVCSAITNLEECSCIFQFIFIQKIDILDLRFSVSIRSRHLVLFGTLKSFSSLLKFHMGAISHCCNGGFNVVVNNSQKFIARLRFCRQIAITCSAFAFETCLQYGL